jgi:hypothetical protein
MPGVLPGARAQRQPAPARDRPLATECHGHSSRNSRTPSPAAARVRVTVAGTPPGLDLLDPKQIAGALRTGYDRAKIEAGKIREFWA